MKPPKLSVSVPASKCIFGTVKCVHVFNVNEKGLCICTLCGCTRAAQGYECDWYKDKDSGALGHDVVDLAAHIAEQDKDAFCKEFEVSY